MEKGHVPTGTHGRLLRRAASTTPPAGTLVTFHGYAQSDDEAMAEALLIPGIDAWTVVAIQALHRFYTRDDRVVASWMTRQDRDLAIADNIEYVNRCLGDGARSPQGSPVPFGHQARSPQGSPVPFEHRARSPQGSPVPLDALELEGDGAALRQASPVPIVFCGFSQGVAMAYRAAVRGRHRAAGVIALAGDIPPELKRDDDFDADRWPPVLIGVGSREAWYTPEKLASDTAWLASRGVPFEVCRFEGGHEWTPAFRDAAAAWLAARAGR